ncbi:hypothetical protein SNE25_09455 [Mucilaginibacter sabulilitoris]|uniref:Uncharacterized protein n=1 Tax=Mucilaginibacter sabulilitoris TaxID=1173583 RepID=A0ABZ0TRI7_9SPHI|nr:hypothetical protein [Mucilaginibacter sabulilitoris]WPU95743.1 hypothetical protein SNE25_09455 [Mucilaginibacter sabulilitoris]
MATYNMEIKNVGPVLTELLAAIPGFDDQQQVYVSSLGPTLSAFGIRELPLPGILNILGIRSLTLNASYDLEPLSRLQVTTAGNHPQEFLKDDKITEALRSLFNNCHTIAFDDWATLRGASVLWNELLINVIKPLGKTGLQYIFYLGNPMGKFSFEVDEALISLVHFHATEKRPSRWMKTKRLNYGAY